jgi:hypothetical protein
MKKRINLVLIILGAILFTVLFHNQTLGLNLLIFELLFFAWLLASGQIKLKGKNMFVACFGYLLSGLFVVITNSIYCITINFLALLVFAGLIIYPEIKSYSNALWLGSTSLITSQIDLLNAMLNSKFKAGKVGNWLWRSKIFIAPSLVVFFFIMIYSFSNPIFGNLTIDIGTFIRQQWNYIFKSFDFSLLVTFTIGISICVFLVYKTASHYIVKYDLHANEQLMRIRTIIPKKTAFTALKNEYRAGVFLLLALNIILLILNIIDIESVWINFDWDGMYLKQFVHVGTYLLIISILISMGIVLYFFRKNLNFYSKNKLLKYLSYGWLIQNGILVISVAIRNFWYIHYFSLAYKRIGIVIFLTATIFGLLSIFLKVYKKKSNFYLIKINAFVLYLILTISSVINWDSIIAKHNFRNYTHSFVHLDYLSTLPDHTLPQLDKPLEELIKIDSTQKDLFAFTRGYMTPQAYHDIIEQRKRDFKSRWENQSWQSWNLPEYLAYQKLFGSKPPSF